MRLPFTVEQFLDVFRQYNDAAWPLQWLLAALAVAAVVLAFRRTPRASRAISGILAILWLWMGIVYHVLYFSAINPAAVVFGAAFIAQGALLLWLGVWRDRLTFANPGRARLAIGGAIILYALVAYPVLGYLLGHRYPAAPTFGVPCPTTILTLGLMVWATRPLPRILVVVPSLWALVGTSAAWELGMREDFGLFIAAMLAITAALTHREHTDGSSLRRSAIPLPR